MYITTEQNASPDCIVILVQVYIHIHALYGSRHRREYDIPPSIEIYSEGVRLEIIIRLLDRAEPEVCYS